MAAQCDSHSKIYGGTEREKCTRKQYINSSKSIPNMSLAVTNWMALATVCTGVGSGAEKPSATSLQWSSGGACGKRCEEEEATRGLEKRQTGDGAGIRQRERERERFGED
uniref:Uncharacterized protein n=1 Tax=Oryza glumipatula TaxID=40148 RepID=A0A0D9YGB5_9ORYZ